MRRSLTCGLALWLASIGGAGAQPRTGADLPRLIAEGHYEAADRFASEELDRRRALFGEAALPVADAADEYIRARLLNGLGPLPETADLARRTLQHREAVTGADDPSLIPSLLNLTDALVATADFTQAVEVGRRTLQLCESRESPLLPDAVERSGWALSEAGQYDEAIAQFERALALRGSGDGPSSLDSARVLTRLGLTLQRKGEYARSAPIVQRVLAIEETRYPDHPVIVEGLNLLAQQLWFEGDLPASRDVSLRAVAAAERLLRPDHPTAARATRYLAGTQFYLGDLRRGVELWQRAHAMVERNFGPLHPETALYAHDVALGQLEAGQYTIARAGFERVLAVFERRFGPWHDYVANTVHNLALVDARLGDRTKARREQARAIDIWTRVYGPSHPYLGVALTELASVLRDQGSPLEALPLLERALAIREQALGPNHPDVARTLADLAATLVRAGRPARAQGLAARALAIWAARDTANAPDYATVLALSGDLEAARGAASAARDAYRRAFDIRERVFGASNPLSAEVQVGLARAQAQLGETHTAFSSALTAEAAGREHLRLLLRTLPEEQALAYAAARPRGLDLLLSLAQSIDRGPGSALDAVVRSRALILDEMAVRQRAARSVDRADPFRAGYVSTQQRLANLLVRGPGPLTPNQYATAVDAARRDAATAEQAFAEQSALFRTEQSGSRTGLTDVVGALAPGSALVSYVRYARRGASSGAASAPTRDVTSYIAFVARPDERVVAVDLGSAATLDPLISRWRRAIVAEATRAPAGADADASRQLGARVRRRIWDPVAGALRDARRVFLVPDGVLNLVPFAALPVGATRFLIDEGPTLHYLSAERDLVSLPAAPAPDGRGFLALGNPAFDRRSTDAARAEPPTPPDGVDGAASPVTVRAVSAIVPAVRPSLDCGSFRSARFEPLHGALAEVRELERLWGSASDSVTVLTGADATERSFKREASRYRVLHLATHGFFIDDGCTPPAPGSRGVGGLSGGPGRRRPNVDANPLRLSGLALAGANRRSTATREEDDGILTAAEVASLDLGKVEWAVLSACDTGVGAIQAGEGIFGLRRAFQTAGARTVVMSLWSVDDRATRTWMRALYEARFRDHASTADAVHAASLDTLRQRRSMHQSTHPFYWAAFVAAGDWR